VQTPMYETISVIIPSEDGSKHLPALECLRNVKYQENKIEIILAIGDCPSCQRNQAVKTAKGDILYFLNKDSKVAPDIFNIAMDVFNRDENIAGAGGPDLTPKDNSFMQQLFGYAMSSYFAHGKMRARYSQIGKERAADEKELILSNLAIKRDILLRSGGFNEKLYPNEENELINRISKMGYKFIYSPDIKVYRNRRGALFAFVRQLYKYGRGRFCLAGIGLFLRFIAERRDDLICLKYLLG